MSEDYTPSMDELRDAWASRYDGETVSAGLEESNGYYAEFDRAISAHDAERAKYESRRHRRHLKEFEAELREKIAREIEAHGEDSGVGAYGTYGPPAITVSDATSIARGKEN